MMLVTVFMVMVSCETLAQSNLKVPKVTKFVYVKDGVNLRKTPNTQSPRLIQKSTNEGIYYKWEEPGDDKSKIKSATYQNPQFLPVIDETPEWYRVIWNEYSDTKILAYISKQVCKSYQKREISEAYIMGRSYNKNEQSNEHIYDMNQFNIRTKGKYTDFCIIYGYVQGPFFEQMYIGKLVKGVLVGKHTGLGGDDVLTDILAEVNGDISKLSDNHIDKLLEEKRVNKHTCYVYALPGSAQSSNGFIPGEGIFTLYLDIDNYEGPTY